MKLNNQKGFTLIELIMVIVILGILAATVVPRFFDFTEDAKEAKGEAIFGALKSGTNLYVANELATNKKKAFPNVVTLQLSDILDDIPSNLSYTPGTENAETGGVTAPGKFIYSEAGYSNTWYYMYNSSKYSLSATDSTSLLTQ